MPYGVTARARAVRGPARPVRGRLDRRHAAERRAGARARRDHGLRPGRLDPRAQPRARGHTVAVIDQDADAFRRLGPDFAGSPVTGVGFDRDVAASRPASSGADAFAAVTSGDNSNIISARVARETFGVEQRRRPHLRPAPRRGLPAARHPDRRDRALDGRPDAAPAAARGRRSDVARPDAAASSLVEVARRPGLDRHAGQRRWRRRPAPASPSSPGSATALLPDRDDRAAGRRPACTSCCVDDDIDRRRRRCCAAGPEEAH